MTAESRWDGYDREEIFMILLLAVLIPVMLLAANLDLRRKPMLDLQQATPPSAIRVWGDDRNWAPNPAALAAANTAAKDSAEAAIMGPGTTSVASTAQDQPASASGDLKASMPGGIRETSMMAVDFSLADLDGARVPSPIRKDAPVTVTKAVIMGDQKIGKIDITIQGEGQLLLEAKAVRALLGQQDAKSEKSLMRLPEHGFVSFAQLRDVGIDLRYLPNEDAIRLNP